MKLLFDANISRKILPMLEDLFPGSSQVMVLGFSGETPDDVIWGMAKERDYTIVTADTDFIRLSAEFGAPPKVIRLEHMDYSTAIAGTLIRYHAVAIAQFESSDRKLLILRRP